MAPRRVRRLLEHPFQAPHGCCTSPPVLRAVLCAPPRAPALQVLDKDLPQFEAVMKEHASGAAWRVVGRPCDGPDVCIRANGAQVFKEARAALHGLWAETSYRMQRARDNAECAEEAFQGIVQDSNPGLTAVVTFDPKIDLALQGRPKVAIQGPCPPH